LYHTVTRDTDEPTEDEEARETEKKERVLHTRIPAVLESELKAAAAALRIPVSNLVRTILEDAVAMADRATGRVESSLERAARSVAAERERLRERVKKLDPLANVVAYQTVVVASPTECTSCMKALEPGDDAALGVTNRPGPKLFVCTECVPHRGSRSADDDPK
jgi:hypothetical protein